MNCIFCKIMNGEIPSYTIYEDDIVKVFLDVNPEVNGHTLIVPKKHQENILEIDENFITHALKLTRDHLYPLLKEKLNCEGLTIEENNFYGQDVKHFHIHLIPRYKNDEYERNANKSILKDLDTIYQTLTEK